MRNPIGARSWANILSDFGVEEAVKLGLFLNDELWPIRELRSKVVLPRPWQIRFLDALAIAEGSNR